MQATNTQDFQENQQQLLILKEFNLFRQQAIIQKQTFYNELEKHKHVNDTFVKKLQKKYEHFMKVQKQKSQKEKEKFTKAIEQQKQSFQCLIKQKNQTIQQLSQIILQLEKEKRQVIEGNTNSLLQLAKSQDKNYFQKQNQYSSQEILKMYQYLLQENQALKKQLNTINLYQCQQERSELNNLSNSPNSNLNSNKIKFYKNNTIQRRAKVIIYTQESNKKAKSPNSQLNIRKNYSFVNSRNDSKQERNLNRVKSNTSEHSSKVLKKQGNLIKHTFESVQQNVQINKNASNKKKTKPAIPINPMQKKKPN